jgi:hypothetical protein
VLLHEIPELRNYPYVSDFVENHLSMQFADVRSMLRLPLPEQGIIDGAGYGGCNFAVATVLCNIVSGISVTIFRPPSLSNNRIGSGRVFIQLLENFYPWEQGDNGGEGAEALYFYFRNPLTHALGVQHEQFYRIGVGKSPSPLQNNQIEEMEESPGRPNWLHPGISGSGTQWNLVAEGFYRDVFHMFWNLARNEQQMRMAEQRFSNGDIVWREE